jgi:hypothetical protein
MVDWQIDNEMKRYHDSEKTRWYEVKPDETKMIRPLPKKNRSVLWYATPDRLLYRPIKKERTRPPMNKKTVGRRWWWK